MSRNVSASCFWQTFYVRILSFLIGQTGKTLWLESARSGRPLAVCHQSGCDYTDIGRSACSQSWDPKSPDLPVGSLSEREVGTHGFHTDDMRLLFGEWGFDYVKVDACGLADYAPDKRYVHDGSFRAFEPYIVRSRPDLSDGTKVEALYADLKNAIDAVRPHGDYVLSICTWGEAYVADWGHRYGNLWRVKPHRYRSRNRMMRLTGHVFSQVRAA
jgi:hypothetical protein